MRMICNLADCPMSFADRSGRKRRRLLAREYGAESLRYALLITISVGVALWIIPLTIIAIVYSRKGERAVGLIR